MNVAILIDGNNIYHGIKLIDGAQGAILDYDSFIPVVLGGRSLNKFVFFLEGETPNKKFGDRIKKKYNGKVISTGFSSDMYIAMEMFKCAVFQKVDTIVLFSGDGDYCPAVEFVQQLGCRVEVVCVEQCLSAHLKKLADKVTFILPENITYLKTKKTVENGESNHSNGSEAGA